MPAPEYILALREKIGHDLLLLPGVTAVVLRDKSAGNQSAGNQSLDHQSLVGNTADPVEVLLGRRADTGRWTLITGILEPGEQPGPGMLREVQEETGVLAEIEHLALVDAQPEPATFPNGDRCQFITLTFRCRYVSGRARVNDDESLEVGWFGLDELPGLSATHRRRLSAALRATGIPEFDRE